MIAVFSGKAMPDKFFSHVFAQIFAWKLATDSSVCWDWNTTNLIAGSCHIVRSLPLHPAIIGQPLQAVKLQDSVDLKQ